jgi:hypothetical protein
MTNFEGIQIVAVAEADFKESSIGKLIPAQYYCVTLQGE